MEDGFLIFAGIVTFVVIVLGKSLGWQNPRDKMYKQRFRRGTGNALLGLQKFIEPSVESIFQAQNVEQKDEEDDNGLDGDEASVRSSLTEAMSRTPIDPEEIRRHLSAAVRLGMDWKALFDQAVENELRERPFRAPSIPPAKQVAPRQ
jgi:hypothetical protein